MWIYFRFFCLECKSKSISGCFRQQTGLFGVNYFSIICGMILVDSKSDEILMLNDVKDLGSFSYRAIYFILLAIKLQKQALLDIL